MLKGSVRIITGIAAGLSLAGHAQGQAHLCVNAAATSTGNGLTWATAFRDLQDAIDAAAASGGAMNEIWIAGGSYRPDRGTNNRDQSFTMFAGLKLIGGFAGFESSASQRNIGGHPTILTGDIGVPGEPSDNSRHVVSFRVMMNSATLDGLIIRDGRADGASFPANSGGGVLSEGMLTVTNCVLESNYAISGAGLFNRFAAPNIALCTFSSNTAQSEGGGAYLRDGGVVNNCVFSGNNGAFGGGLWVNNAASRISGSWFSANFGNTGGALFNSSGGMVLTGCSFTSNSGGNGGAVHCGTGSWTTNCFFGGNSANQGGGVYASGAATLVNCVFSRNSTVGSGGAIYVPATCTLTATNITAHGNNSLLFGGAVYITGGGMNLANSILWSNTDVQSNTQNAQVTRASGTLAVNTTTIAGWSGTLGGSGNNAAAPVFVDPSGPDGIPGSFDDDFRLSASSPAIDAGNVQALPLDSSDMDADGNTSEATPIDISDMPRIVQAILPVPTVDRGALEYQPPPTVAGDANRDGIVTFPDITEVLQSWGATSDPADVDNSGSVGFSDVTMVLVNWGG